MITRKQGEQVGKEDQRNDTGCRPENRLALTKPRPEGEASGDFRQRGRDENQGCAENTWHASVFQNRVEAANGHEGLLVPSQNVDRN